MNASARILSLSIALVVIFTAVIYSTNILKFRNPAHLPDDTGPNITQQNSSEAEIENLSTPLVLYEQLSELEVYKNDKLGIEISHPAEWGINEQFDVNLYEERRIWTENPVRFNHDFYSIVRFYPLSQSSYYGINDLSVKVYPNPNNLSLFDFFKGRFEPLGEPKYFPEDTFMSRLINQGEIVSFGKYRGKAVRDMSYSDVGNQIHRKIYLTHGSKIYEVSLGYIYGEGFQLPSEPVLMENNFWVTPAPPLFETFVKKIGDSLIIY